MRIEVVFGSIKELTKPVKYTEKNKGYKFKKKHNIKPIKTSYPTDSRQIPDVIITLQAQKLLGGIWKVGYFRVKAADLLKQDGPRWFKFKSLEKPHSSPGKLLVNISLYPADKVKKTPHRIKQTADSPFKLYYNLFYCLDISVDNTKEEKVQSKMKLEIGSKVIKELPYKPTHIPLWNESGTQDITLPKNLSFAPDLTVTLIQKGWFSEYDVGEINIPLNTINEDFAEPKFYQFSSYGDIKGKLLAIFNIEEQDPKNLEERDFNRAVKHNSDILTHADIRFALVGIRNLVGNTNNLKMEVNLLYLKPNEDSSYTMEVKDGEDEKLEEEEKNEYAETNRRLNRNSNLDEEESDNSYMEDDDEELGLHSKKEMLERKSVNPELITEIKEKDKIETKVTDTNDIEKNITRTGAEVPKNLGEMIECIPLETNPTNTPNFLKIINFKDVPFCQHPFLWPIIWIKVRDTGFYGKAENLDLLFPLIKYVDFLDLKSKRNNLKELKKAYKVKLSELDETTIKSETTVIESVQSDQESEESESEMSSEEVIKDEGEKDDEEEESENEGEEEEKVEQPTKTKKTDKGDETQDEENLILDDHEFYHDYHKRITSIKLPSLEDRVKDKCMVEMYKENNID